MTETGLCCRPSLLTLLKLIFSGARKAEVQKYYCFIFKIGWISFSLVAEKWSSLMHSTGRFLSRSTKKWTFLISSLFMFEDWSGKPAGQKSSFRNTRGITPCSLEWNLANANYLFGCIIFPFFMNENDEEEEVKQETLHSRQ